jgi:endonuclease/exonuclease/phosphatase family metal-dependent hydrolase
MMRLRVATYNVHKCRGLDRRTSPHRIAAVIRELNADVVALQEVVHVENGRSAFDQVRCITEQFSEYRWCFGENRELHGGTYGNLTLSRFPLAHCENYDVSWRNRERRGCLRTDLAVSEDVVIHIFNVHLGTGFMERRRQARLLLSDEVLNRKELAAPRIVVGDFNEWTRGLTTELMRESFEAVEPKAFLRYARTYPGVFPLLHLDHFYFDRQLSLQSFRLHRSRKALIASDHLPLVAELALDA